MSALLDVLSWGLLVGGGVVSVVSGLGLLRFPDLYTRMHAASMLDTLGAAMILLGLVLQAGFGVVAFKLLLVLGFLAFTTTTAAHALAKSAMASGLEPHGTALPPGTGLPQGMERLEPSVAEAARDGGDA